MYTLDSNSYLQAQQEQAAAEAAQSSASSSAAEERRLQHAFGPDLYADYLVCKDLPLQCKEEAYVGAREAALIGRRIEEVKALKEERAILAYKPTGVSAARMRALLANVLLRINVRYSDLVKADDDVSCEICVIYEDKIRKMLLDNPPTDATLDAVSTASGEETVPMGPSSMQLDDSEMKNCKSAVW